MSVHMETDHAVYLKVQNNKYPLLVLKNPATRPQRIMTTHINKRYSDESLWLLLDDLKFVNALHHIRNGRIQR